jgi:glucose-1-phosphate thymidylyltransferase
MKAILLAGGIGSRLFPATLAISKQLIPVYDKPMIYYPLSTLIMAGIREVLIICTLENINQYKILLGNGSQWGIIILYKVQPKPNGISESFLLGEEFIGQDPICLILGDNIFYGLDFSKQLNEVVKRTEMGGKATIFGYTVNNPERYGVIEFDEDGNALSIIEKPKNPKSDKAVVGLYFYPNEVVEVAKNIKPSRRGELEITSINQYFLEQQKLEVETLSHGFTWLDTGTHESLLEASQFIETIEKRQGIKIGCLEELAFQKGYINLENLLDQTQKLLGSSYGNYLQERYF